MPVVVLIPGPLRELAGDRAKIRLDEAPASVSEALSQLWRKCPGVRDRVITEQGDVRPHINIFVDGESIRDSDGLGTPVRNGAEIVILPAVSGG
jgi:molybdopterin converting factor small subunit